jgi:hypothetical protein
MIMKKDVSLPPESLILKTVVTGEINDKYFILGNKKPSINWVFKRSYQLLDFSFFVHNMLTDARIEFFDLHLFRHGFLVLVGSVKMTSTGTRN